MRTKKTKKNPVNKKVQNATPLTYYGIKFKSKLELHCYKKLKEANIKFQYEKVKFEIVPGFVFQNESIELFKRKGERFFGKQNNKIRPITYTPDFVGYYPGTDKMFVIETKGNPNDAFPIRWKLFKRYLHTSKSDYDLYMPRNQKLTLQTIELILNKYD